MTDTAPPKGEVLLLLFLFYRPLRKYPAEPSGRLRTLSDKACIPQPKRRLPVTHVITKIQKASLSEVFQCIVPLL